MPCIIPVEQPTAVLAEPDARLSLGVTGLMIDNLEVPKPPGIAALPTGERGVVIAAHVPRPSGVPRITEVDPNRPLVLAVERRCGLCAREFQPGERFWYVTWPQTSSRYRSPAGSTGTSLWKAAHEERGRLEHR